MSVRSSQISSVNSSAGQLLLRGLIRFTSVVMISGVSVSVMSKVLVGQAPSLGSATSTWMTLGSTVGR